MWTNVAVAAAARDGDTCQISSARITLCFDLRDDSHPNSGLMLNITAVDGTNHLVYLPFQTASPSGDRSILSSWGSYEESTIIGFSTIADGRHTIGFVPTIDGSPASLDDRASRSSVVLVRSGLERDFVYRSRGISSDAFLQAQKGLVVDSIELIGVVRPKGAKGLEVSNGRIEEPEATQVIGNTRFYPASASGHGDTRLEVRYEIPATPLVTLILSDLAKLAAAFFAPLVTIAFFTLQENVRPRARRWTLICLVVIQLCIAGILGYLAWKVRNDASSAAVSDWLIVVVTAAASALPLWLKRDRGRDPLTFSP